MDADGFLKDGFSLQGKRIWVAGHRGLVGSALCRRLSEEDCTFILAGRSELDLLRQGPVDDFVDAKKPDVVVLAAARVGGISANAENPGSFLYENLSIAANVIEASRRHGVKKLLFLGSSCIYPRQASEPITEEALLSGPLEPTNEWYAVAKIAGLKLCQAFRRQYGCDFISAMPCNLYGPRDNFDPDVSHVIPALMTKAHEAKNFGQPFVVWGSGKPRREFLFVDDLAEALVFLLKHYSHEKPVNVGSGSDLSIAELAAKICRVAGYEGPVTYDPSRPDGVDGKLMDSGRIAAMGWKPSIGLDEGLELTYKWFRAYRESAART